jgi:glycoside/pentoside/hexuronide:cation symporter, GPH family
LRGFQYTMGLFAFASIILFWITFLTTKERVQPPAGQKQNAIEELKELVGNVPWVTLFFAAIFSTTFVYTRDSVTIHFFKYVVKTGNEPILLGMDKTSLFLALGRFAMMLGVFCVGFLIKRIDKKPLAIVLTFVTAVCWFSFYFIPHHMYGWMLALNVVGSFMMGPTSALVWSMYGDVADYGQVKYGRRSTGLIHSGSLFALKTGTVIAGATAGWLLSLFGFVANQPQSASAMRGIILMFTLLPAFLALCKGTMLILYPLNRAKVLENERELARRAESAVAKA